MLEDRETNIIIINMVVSKTSEGRQICLNPMVTGMCGVQLKDRQRTEDVVASIRRFLTSTATATLVSAFVLSRIDYCNSLLFGSTNDVTSHLQWIQNYAARVIFRLPMSSSITIHL